MNKKVSLGKAIAINIITIAATIAITMAISMKVYNNLIKELPKRVNMFSNISEMDEIVRKEFFGDVKTTKLNADIQRGYVKGLGDDSSFYMTADEYIEFYNRERGKMSGIGITHSLNRDTGYIHVTGVAKDSPAEVAGLKVGDEIFLIGDTKCTADNYEKMSKQLVGEKMSSVNITYKRGKDDTAISVAKGYTQTTVLSRKLGSNAIVTINAFYENTIPQFEEVISQLKKEKIKGIVFDVRNCSEGSIENAVKIIDKLVPLATDGKKAIAVAVDKKGKTIKTFPSDAHDYVVPIVVLTNKNTAGAAELFACDLRDFGRAEIVGTKTKGVGTLQKIFQFDDGSAVVLTIAEIFPYKSKSYNKVGVNPDYKVKLKESQEKKIGIMNDSDDPQIQKALSLLPQDK